LEAKGGDKMGVVVRVFNLSMCGMAAFICIAVLMSGQLPIATAIPLVVVLLLTLTMFAIILYYTLHCDIIERWRHE